MLSFINFVGAQEYKSVDSETVGVSIKFLVNKLSLTVSMSVAEIVIFAVGLLFSILSHCIAWAIHTKVSRVLERLKDCDDNLKSAAKLVENSSTTGSVLQLSAEQLRFDPDVNEFERDVAVLMLKDPQLTYTGETMHRANKAKSPQVENKKSPKKSVETAKAKSAEEAERELAKLAEHKMPGNARPPTPLPGSSDEDKNPDRKKFKPPPNIAKADAKDPAYETLQGIGNELFNVAKPENKSKSKKVDAAAEKDKFKQPPKIQKADAKDPEYETLADVKDDIFKRQ
ncbi:unnamed protein product [Cylicocyclus nassatus]|uniref:Uncharacterized protein n=1 Tax=Cylicocyclus nassatus TaxID=53992 RepID=A0AA36H676_CYLNA|nr:unnamed protein product [Cylicocyclus nassatus]